ncbi:hypothetical protein GCM10010517_19880 [Streptosporangium fragile]|uniref:RNA polymerase alpha subunit C-terminal domain-containing protein n=1 Tax=Streptosporangium fragile TaxID=46186 RepID=A0ABP6IBB9_9ACTN
MVTDAALRRNEALPIEELDLTVRSYNRLKREGIHTCGELAAHSDEELLAIAGIGRESVEEIKQRLADVDLSLRPHDVPRTRATFVDMICTVAFHPGGHLLAVAGADHAAWSWEGPSPTFVTFPLPHLAPGGRGR